MITDAIINLFFAPIEWALDLIVGNIDFSAVAFDHIVSNLSAMNYWLPITELAIFVVAVFAVGPFNIFVSSALWLAIGVIRGGNHKI